MKSVQEKIKELVKTIHELHNLNDAVYSVRESADMENFEGSSWDHPDVVKYSESVQELFDLLGLK